MGITETKTTLAWRWCSQQPEFTSRQLQQVAEMNKRYSNQVIAQWVATGVIELITASERIDSVFHPARYRVINPECAPPLGQGNNQAGRCYQRRRAWRKTQQQKMWNSMKIGRAFTLTDLMLTCDTQRAKAYAYVKRLEQAGYVRMLQCRQQKNLPVAERMGARYQLVRDTGRHSPIIHSNGCWDQNEQRLYAFEVPGADSEQGVKHDYVA